MRGYSLEMKNAINLIYNVISRLRYNVLCLYLRLLQSNYSLRVLLNNIDIISQPPAEGFQSVLRCLLQQCRHIAVFCARLLKRIKISIADFHRYRDIYYRLSQIQRYLLQTFIGVQRYLMWAFIDAKAFIAYIRVSEITKVA